MTLTNKQINVLTGLILCLLVILTAVIAHLSGKYPLEDIGAFLLLLLPSSAVPIFAAIEPRHRDK